MDSNELAIVLTDFAINRKSEWVIYGDYHLEENTWTDDDMDTLIACIAIYQPTILVLANLGLNNKQVIRLATELKTNHSIKILQLPFNAFGNKSAEALSDMLMTNQSITHLSLIANQFTDTGVEKIADSLASNHTLTELELFSNHLSERILPHFTKALSHNHEIEKLILFAPNESKRLTPALNEKLAKNLAHHQERRSELRKISLFSSHRRQKQLRMMENLNKIEIGQPINGRQLQTRK